MAVFPVINYLVTEFYSLCRKDFFLLIYSVSDNALGTFKPV